MLTHALGIEPFERTYRELVAGGAPEETAIQSAAMVWRWHHPGTTRLQADRAVRIWVDCARAQELARRGRIV